MIASVACLQNQPDPLGQPSLSGLFVPTRTARQVLAEREPITIGADVVHVWAMNIDAPEVDECGSLLDVEEKQRLSRFSSLIVIQRFAIAHGLARAILARYLRVEPVGIVFERAVEGKPYIAAPICNLSFSLSHSYGRAILAVSRGRQVGADVEALRHEVDILRIARKHFTTAEYGALLGAPANGQRGAFFARWVAKEAFLKATGVGLRFPLDRLEVVFAPGAGTASIRLPHVGGIACDWSVRMITLEGGWPGAVSAPGRMCQVVAP